MIYLFLQVFSSNINPVSFIYLFFAIGKIINNLLEYSIFLEEHDLDGVVTVWKEMIIDLSLFSCSNKWVMLNPPLNIHIQWSPQTSFYHQPIIASGILVPSSHIWPVHKDQYLQPHPSLVTDAYSIHTATFVLWYRRNGRSREGLVMNERDLCVLCTRREQRICTAQEWQESGPPLYLLVVAFQGWIRGSWKNLNFALLLPIHTNSTVCTA